MLEKSHLASRRTCLRTNHLATIVRILNTLHRRGGRNAVRKRRKRAGRIRKHVHRSDAVLRRRRWRLVHRLWLLVTLEFLGHTLIFGEQTVMFATCALEIMAHAVELLIGMLAVLDSTFELFDIVRCCNSKLSVRSLHFLARDISARERKHTLGEDFPFTRLGSLMRRYLHA